MCLDVLVLAYFVMRVIAVVNYQDPAITSYSIREDRNEMESPYNFAEFNQNLAFVMMEADTVTPVSIDPRYGDLYITSFSNHFSVSGALKNETTIMELETIAESDDDAMANALKGYGPKSALT